MRARSLSTLGCCRLMPLAAAALVALAHSPAQAADVDAVVPAVRLPDPVATSDMPMFSATLYLWASALKGTSSTLPPLPAVDIDLRFRDILQDLNGAVMGAGEMRVGRWGFLADLMFTQVTPTGALPGPYGAEVEVRSRSLTLQGDVLYRLYESDMLDLDAGAGLRFWHLDNRLTVAPGLPSVLEYAQSESWVDPVIAGRAIARLGGPWSLTLVGDIGGFDVGSSLTWQAIATVNYQWSDQLALRAGYRALSVDYQSGAFLYDVLMQGPILGVTYRF
ncbi:hypothetical protein [Ancylobacter sp. IITR112]|uniref:hypothetical protein n=1 Tax=Ancylobacter sp. IITR112 TaxID=3138073 RepID=UPI00352AFC4A